MSIFYHKNIKKQFEKSLQSYDKNAVVQILMASMLVDKLSEIRDNFDCILELGSGTGILTKELSKSVKFNHFYVNDIVEKSKVYLANILPDAQFLFGNALKIRPSKKPDLIISNAMFQWFNNLDKAIENLKQKLAKDGILAFSTFSPENFCEIKALTGLTLDYKSVEEIQKILVKHNFEILYCNNFSKILEFNSPLEILAHMKNTGVNSLSETTWTIKNVKEFCDKYCEKYSKIQLTYSPIIMICKNK